MQPDHLGYASRGTHGRLWPLLVALKFAFSMQVTCSLQESHDQFSEFEV